MVDYKGYEFYLFGCSHSSNLHHETFPYFDKAVTLCYGGNSNDRILRELKDTILHLTNNLTQKVDNIYFNIQFTYFNRFEIYSDVDKKYIPFHSPNIAKQHFTENHPLSKEYNEFYKNWLTYIFDEETRLKELLIECKILKNLMDSFGIKYSWCLWAGIHGVEIVNSEKQIIQQNIIFANEFEELGFEKFDEFWYFEDYAKFNKMRNCDITDNIDEHLHTEANYVLAEIVKLKFIQKT
jgi:hypothetical protein